MSSSSQGTAHEDGSGSGSSPGTGKHSPSSPAPSSSAQPHPHTRHRARGTSASRLSSGGSSAAATAGARVFRVLIVGGDVKTESLLTYNYLSHLFVAQSQVRAQYQARAAACAKEAAAKAKAGGEADEKVKGSDESAAVAVSVPEDEPYVDLIDRGAKKPEEEKVKPKEKAADAKPAKVEDPQPEAPVQEPEKGDAEPSSQVSLDGDDDPEPSLTMGQKEYLSPPGSLQHGLVDMDEDSDVRSGPLQGVPSSDSDEDAAFMPDEPGEDDSERTPVPVTGTAEERTPLFGGSESSASASGSGSGTGSGGSSGSESGLTLDEVEVESDDVVAEPDEGEPKMVKVDVEADADVEADVDVDAAAASPRTPVVTRTKDPEGSPTPELKVPSLSLTSVPADKNQGEGPSASEAEPRPPKSPRLPEDRIGVIGRFNPFQFKGATEDSFIKEMRTRGVTPKTPHLRSIIHAVEDKDTKKYHHHRGVPGSASISDDDEFGLGGGSLQMPPSAQERLKLKISAEDGIGEGQDDVPVTPGSETPREKKVLVAVAVAVAKQPVTIVKEVVSHPRTTTPDPESKYPTETRRQRAIRKRRLSRSRSLLIKRSMLPPAVLRLQQEQRESPEAHSSRDRDHDRDRARESEKSGTKKETPSKGRSGRKRRRRRARFGEKAAQAPIGASIDFEAERMRLNFSPSSPLPEDEGSPTKTARNRTVSNVKLLLRFYQEMKEDKAKGFDKVNRHLEVTNDDLRTDLLRMREAAVQRQEELARMKKHLEKLKTQWMAARTERRDRHLRMKQKRKQVTDLLQLHERCLDILAPRILTPEPPVPHSHSHSHAHSDAVPSPSSEPQQAPVHRRDERVSEKQTFVRSFRRSLDIFNGLKVKKGIQILDEQLHFSRIEEIPVLFFKFLNFQRMKICEFLSLQVNETMLRRFVEAYFEGVLLKPAGGAQLPEEQVSAFAYEYVAYLCHFLRFFRTPREGQKVIRILEAFSLAYRKVRLRGVLPPNFTDHKMFEFATSVVLLNTALHNPAASRSRSRVFHAQSRKMFFSAAKDYLPVKVTTNIYEWMRKKDPLSAVLDPRLAAVEAMVATKDQDTPWNRLFLYHRANFFELLFLNVEYEDLMGKLRVHGRDPTLTNFVRQSDFFVLVWKDVAGFDYVSEFSKYLRKLGQVRSNVVLVNFTSQKLSRNVFPFPCFSYRNLDFRNLTIQMFDFVLTTQSERGKSAALDILQKIHSDQDPLLRRMPFEKLLMLPALLI